MMDALLEMSLNQKRTVCCLILLSVDWHLAVRHHEFCSAVWIFFSKAESQTVCQT